MPGGEDWLLLPVIEGMCKYESLLDGTISLYDLALMHDALAVKHENQARYQKSKEQNKV